MGGGTEQATSNLNLYTTNSTTVRDMNAKDTGIGTESIWSGKTNGATLNEAATGFAIKGNVAGNTRIEIEVTLTTTGKCSGKHICK